MTPLHVSKALGILLFVLTAVLTLRVLASISMENQDAFVFAGLVGAGLLTRATALRWSPRFEAGRSNAQLVGMGCGGLALMPIALALFALLAGALLPPRLTGSAANGAVGAVMICILIAGYLVFSCILLQGVTGKRDRFVGGGLGALLGFFLVFGAVPLLQRRVEAPVNPKPVLPKDNAYDGFARAIMLLGPHRSPYALPDPVEEVQTYANFKACADDNARALAVLHEELDKPYLYPPIRSFWNLMLVRPDFRELADTAAGAAKYEELDGRMGRAADILLDGIELGVTIPRGGNVSVAETGNMVESICERRLDPLLPRLSASDLGHVSVRLERIRGKRIPFSDVAMADYDAAIACLPQTIKLDRLQVGEGRSLHVRNGWWRDPRNGLVQVRDSKQHMLDENLLYARELAEESKRPYAGPSHIRLPNNPLAHIVFQETFCNQREIFTAADAVFELLRTETALYRYRAARGRFPSALADLAPQYLDAAPMDPFGGQPLHYAPANGGRAFLLYSLGPRLADLGGRPGQYPRDLSGNIVAGMMWNPRPVPRTYIAPAPRSMPFAPWNTGSAPGAFVPRSTLD